MDETLDNKGEKLKNAMQYKFIQKCLNEKQNHFDDSNWIKERENILRYTRWKTNHKRIRCDFLSN